MKTAQEIQAGLGYFTGTENWYKHLTGLLYTDGVQYLAEAAQCYWLIDLIASYQEGHIKNLYQVWNLHVDASSRAVLEMYTHTKEPAVHREIDFTDFPLPHIQLIYANGVLCLPSED